MLEGNRHHGNQRPAVRGGPLSGNGRRPGGPLSDAVDSGDPRYIAYALGAIARARGGGGRLAREAGMNRQALPKALSEDGNPTLETVLKVLKAFWLDMRIEERGAA